MGLVPVLTADRRQYDRRVEEIRVALASGERVLVRVSCINGRWLASADTPHGPSVGLGRDRLAAIYVAVDAYQPEVDAVLDALLPGAGAPERAST